MVQQKRDLAFPTRMDSDPKAWRGLDTLFLPGWPRHMDDGARVWLRHGDRFVYSYEIKSVVHEDERRSVIDGQDLGSGPSLLLKPRSGRVENKRLASVADPDGVRDSWGRGFRYLTRGARRFVRVGRALPTRPRRVGRLISPDYGRTDSRQVVTKARARQMDRTEAKLVQEFLTWMNGHGVLKTLAIPIGRRGDIRADLYNAAADVLIEEKRRRPVYQPIWV